MRSSSKRTGASGFRGAAAASTADSRAVGFGGEFGHPTAGRQGAERRVECVLLIGLPPPERRPSFLRRDGRVAKSDNPPGHFQLEPCRLPDADWLREKYSPSCEGGFDSHIRLSASSRSSALSTM